MITYIDKYTAITQLSFMHMHAHTYVYVYMYMHVDEFRIRKGNEFISIKLIYYEQAHVHACARDFFINFFLIISYMHAYI
jgi:hypothetical protein